MGEGINMTPGRHIAEMYPGGIDNQKICAVVMEKLEISWFDWVNGWYPPVYFYMEDLVKYAKRLNIMWEIDDFSTSPVPAINNLIPFSGNSYTILTPVSNSIFDLAGREIQSWKSGGNGCVVTLSQPGARARTEKRIHVSHQ
jgi:hypothetical protein